MSEGLTQNIMEELKQGYLASLPGRIEEIEQYALAMEKGGNFDENYAALYRVVHSLKGSGGTYGFYIITNICHQMEDWFSSLEHSASLDSAQEDMLLKYVDALRGSLGKINQGATSFGDIEEQLAELKKSSSENKLSGLLVDSSNTNASIIAETLGTYKVNLARAPDSLSALSRLMTEKFDFVISSQEVGPLKGSGMIAALKLSHGNSRHAKTVLMTTGSTLLSEPGDLQPDVVIKKDAKLSHNIAQSMMLLGLSV